MGIASMIEEIRRGDDFASVGMIVSHNGVVRSVSRDGNPVHGMELTADRNRLAEIVADMRTRPGIVALQAEIYEGILKTGDDIMCVVVAGDIRDHVFPVLLETVTAIKRDVVTEREF